MKKLLTGAVTCAAVLSATAIPSFAATVDLPAEFSNLTDIIQKILEIIEFISKIVSLFA